jgi:tetratricopeptide (TPR) repeat protein
MPPEPSGGARAAARWPGQANRSPAALLAYLALPLAALVLSVTQNLQVIHADIVYKTGLQFDDSGQPQVAIPLYEYALGLAPNEDYYYLFLGRAYLNATQLQTDQAQVEALLREAESQLVRARRLNPLNTDHTANLARLSRRWAELLPDGEQRALRAQTSADYYVAAVALSPNNAGLWNERAALEMQVRGDLDTAQTYLDQSFGLDDRYDQTYLLQGDLFYARARQTAEADEQRTWSERAVEAYLRGIQAAEARGVSTASLRLNLAAVYTQLGQAQAAIDEYQQVLDDGAASVQPWRLHLAISELQAQLGDMAQARGSAELALQLAPDTDKPTVQAWLDRLP